MQGRLNSKLVEWIASSVMAVVGLHAAVTINWSTPDVPRAVLLGIMMALLATNNERYRLSRLIEKQSAQLAERGQPLPTQGSVMPKWAVYGVRLLAVVAGFLFIWLVSRN